MVKNNFSLFEPSWNASEELLLLNGILKFGYGNWDDIAKSVTTKDAAECQVILNRPDFSKCSLPTLFHTISPGDIIQYYDETKVEGTPDSYVHSQFYDHVYNGEKGNNLIAFRVNPTKENALLTEYADV